MLPIDINSVKGFLDETEGMALYEYGLRASALGPCLEIGSYCGKSTLYLGSACKRAGSVLFAIDHHRGSEEHQLGEEYHDASLYDEKTQRMDTLYEFRRTLMRANLEDTVIPIVAPSLLVARYWQTPLSFVFIDGGHSVQAALNDYHQWAKHILPGGYLAIHDVFPNPADGGRPPHDIWQLAQSSGLFSALPLIKTLGLLKRKDC